MLRRSPDSEGRVGHGPRKGLWVGLAVAVAATLLLAVSNGLHGAFLAAAHWIERRAVHAGVLGPVVFTLLGVLSALLSPVSSAPLVPPAVLAWGRWPTVGLLVLGWTLGGAIAWLVGRAAGRRLLARSARLCAADARLRSLRASFLAALALRVALPSEVGYAYGVLRYSFAKYMRMTVVAEIPSALPLVLVSDALLQRRLGLALAVLGLAAEARS